jgi:hypothetical protein
MPVNTAKVAGRRTLDYASFEELLADAERLGAGPTKALGNWSAGQIFRHIAVTCNNSIDGFPFTFPWYLRTAATLFKGRLMKGSMPAGFKLPGAKAGAMLPPETPTEEGLAELRAAVARLQREPHRAIHPLFGAISREEWDRVHLKHASLHMSFLVPV